MQTKKMSLVHIQGKLSRAEMKNIMGGVDQEIAPDSGNNGGQCYGTGTWVGSCNYADILKYCKFGGYCY